MFGKKTRRERPARANRGADRSFDRGGYPGLEGDFESERRRAAAADHHTLEPYEHGEGELAVLPVTEPGLTHP
ncbi:hypothetical protein E3O42_04200 [Cryobacterium adonitolivorans]|uniref:Uncharacterized protein n=1 Tax=Cryobacterium adonitolivorans TaxID=1259189 RepID=A0A4R8WC79_9MICO|nr:hypothetical protein [Cryobacterium adonitolivorans]TFC04714.1 hypothetical protein E3O42_04200 [Cryobacterium adonitolivorans]